MPLMTISVLKAEPSAGDGRNCSGKGASVCLLYCGQSFGKSHSRGEYFT